MPHGMSQCARATGAGAMRSTPRRIRCRKDMTPTYPPFLFMAVATASPLRGPPLQPRGPRRSGANVRAVCEQDVVDGSLRQVVHVRVRPEQGEASDPQAEFLPQFPPQRLDGGLADLNLAAGELPLPREGASARPPQQEHAPPVPEDGDDDGDRNALHGADIAANG